MKTKLPKSNREVSVAELPKKPHQWEVTHYVGLVPTHGCVVCHKQKPQDYENYNECPGEPDLFLHFKEDISLIRKKESSHV